VRNLEDDIAGEPLVRAHGLRRSVASLLIAFLCSSACGLGGDGGLVPLLLGLGPPSDPSSGETERGSNNTAAAAPPRLQSVPPATRIAPKQSAAAPPEQAESVKPEVAPGQRVGGEPSVDEKLGALKRLHDRRLLSDAEYQSRRQRLLDSN